MATGLTFPLIRFNKDPVVISKNCFNGLNKFKRKIDAPKKFIDFKYCTKKMHARRYHRCNFFQNIKKSMPVYKTSLFLIPMNQYVNVLQQKRHFTDLFLMA